jgi:hypothetical protein
LSPLVLQPLIATSASPSIIDLLITDLMRYASVEFTLPEIEPPSDCGAKTRSCPHTIKLRANSLRADTITDIRLVFGWIGTASAQSIAGITH